MKKNILHSEQAEKLLLGLLISNNQLVSKVAGLINSDDFFILENQELYQAINNSFQKHSSADSPFLLEELVLISSKSKGQWIDYISEISLEKGVENNIEKYVELIKEKKQTRELKNTLINSVDLVEKGGNSISNLIGQVESKIQDITRQRELKDFENIESLTQEFLLKMKQQQEEGYQSGLRTGYPALDRSLGGLKGGQFIVVAARPSMGKTAFSLEIAKNIALKGNKVGFFSLEMPSDQLILRMLSSESMIDPKTMFSPNTSLNQMQLERLNYAKSKIKSMEMRIDDSATLKIGELAWKARKAKEQDGLDLIIIDYLQLIDSESNGGESRQQIISDISRQLKAIARELDIPVIALSQLSRRVENRDNKRPMMSDIRESGAVEQDADIIMLLYREDYYKSDEDKNKTSHNVLEVIIGKNRNGATGSVKLVLDLAHGKLMSLTNEGGK